MARKPGFKRTSKVANQPQAGEAISFSKYQDYYDYGTKRETDGERFAVSDIKKAMNCYYDAITCYEKGIQVFQQNSILLQGELSTYQNVWYNYLRLLFFLLAEYKFVSGSIDILKFLPENTVKKEMNELLFEKKDVMTTLYKSYSDCRSIIPLSCDTWDFYYNFMEFLNSFIEWHISTDFDMKVLLDSLFDQQDLFNQLMSLQMDVMMSYVNKSHLNNNNSTDPVIQANMNLQKDIRFTINKENDNFAETMSNLTLSTFLEIYEIVFKSLRHGLEDFYQNISKQEMNVESNFGLLDDIKRLNNFYFGHYSDFINSINCYGLREELETTLITEVDYSIQFNAILLKMSDPSAIAGLVNERLTQLNAESDLAAHLNKETTILEIDQWDSILELLVPIDEALNSVITKEFPRENQNPLSELYSWETKWNISMILNKLTSALSKQMGEKIKATLHKTKEFSSLCCNLVDILQNKSDLEIKRAYLKCDPICKASTNANEFSILAQNSLSYLKNASVYCSLDMGFSEQINDKLYRQYLMQETQVKTVQLGHVFT